MRETALVALTRRRKGESSPRNGRSVVASDLAGYLVSLARNSAWAAAAAVTLTGARFAFAAIVARRLVQAGFGQFAYGQWLVDLAFLVCSIGMAGVASRYVAEYHTRPEKLAALMVRWRPFAFGLPILSSGGVLLGAFISGLHLDHAGLLLLAVWAAANGFWAMQTAVLTGMQRFDLIFRATAFAAAIMIVGALILPLDHDGVGILFGLMATAFGAAAVVGLATSRRLISGVIGFIERDDWRGIRRYAFNIWITALLWSLVWSRGEMPIVRAYLGDAGVAHYAAALTLFGGAIQGAMLAVSGIAPQLTMLWGSDRRDEAIAAARTVMDVQLLFCGAGALLLIYLGPELISLAFGKSYRDAAAPLTVFAVGLLAMGVSAQNYILQLATDARFSRNITLVGLVTLFGAAIALTPLYGLVGTAIARAGTMLVMAGAALVAITRRWGGTAITGRNVLIVAAVVGASASSLAWRASPPLVRVILLGLGLVVLGLSLRDRQGRLLSAVVPAIFLRLVLAAVRNANSPSKVRTE